jgi:hypothetical protein
MVAFDPNRTFLPLVRGGDPEAECEDNEHEEAEARDGETFIHPGASLRHWRTTMRERPLARPRTDALFPYPVERTAFSRSTAHNCASSWCARRAGAFVLALAAARSASSRANSCSGEGRVRLS